MHNDLTKLKELAEAAKLARPGEWYNEGDCCWWTGNVDEGDFLAAANPQAILALIAEVERLRSDLPRLVSYAEDLSTCTLTMDDGDGYFYNRVTNKELAEIDQLTQEVAWLRKRLEISDKHPYDGIACRDETIKGLDEKCGRLEAENEALREKLNDCAISLHGEMLQKYGGQLPDDMHPVTRRDYNRDMAEVAEYRAALEGGGNGRS